MSWRAFSFVLVTVTCLATAGQGGYHLLSVSKLGGEGGWDYLTVDAQARRVYISRATHVIVLDADSGKVTGDIPDTPGVHGIALAPGLGRGFISNGREGTVSVFELKTLKLITKVKAGENPDAILYDPSTERVYAFNGRSHDATVIDAEKAEAVHTIPLDGKPEFGVSDERGTVFVNIEDKSELTAIDARSMQVKATWPLAPCEEPSGLAMDRKHRRLFSGCSNRMMAVVDADTGKVLATPEIGEGVDADAFDDKTGLAFASCGDGTLTAVHEDSPAKFTVLEQVKTRKGARTMALDARTHRIFTVTADYGPAPAASLDNPRPRPAILKDTFVVMVYGR